MHSAKHKVILVIRDGWGQREEKNHNAIFETPTPNTDGLMREYPHTLIDTSGASVGLPAGYQGNSEVGHMTIGSGRIIFQSLPRINKSIADKSFYRIPEFLEAIDNCRKHDTKLHIIGLLQVEGVHSHKDHLYALLELCKLNDFKDVWVHVITDGRDAPVTASEGHLAELEAKLRSLGFGKIASISGRYYTMDRDKRWDRIKKAYDCIVNAECDDTFLDALEKVKVCHAKGETDEFIIPRRAEDYLGVREHDSIIFYNFRTDRTRELTQAIVEDKFDGWERKPLKVFYVAMTPFYNPMDAHVAFKDQSTKRLLGDIISENGLKQLRISETEKYAHVTFFFNCQREESLPGEERILVPSPKVATYDLQPEMSVREVTDKLVEEIGKEKFDFIVTNLVNCDMVGHTGIVEAIKKAVAAVDESTARIVKAGLEHSYTLLIFADHGNAEDQTEKWRTSHTLNKVPFLLVSSDEELKKASLRKDSGLQDIAPTVLGLMGLPVPEEMTSKSILL